MAKAATSRKQKSEVRYQNFKVSPAATILKIMNNAGDLDTHGLKKSLDRLKVLCYTCNVYNCARMADICA